MPFVSAENGPGRTNSAKLLTGIPDGPHLHQLERLNMRQRSEQPRIAGEKTLFLALAASGRQPVYALKHAAGSNVLSMLSGF